jgi:hypothetical protein
MPGQTASPFEAVVGPMEVWTAPSDTVFPLRAFLASWDGENDAQSVIDEWKPIPRTGGENGVLRQSDEGVTINFSHSIERIRASGSTLPIKIIRTEEDIVISFMVLDTTPLAVAAALRNAGAPAGLITHIDAASPYPAHDKMVLERSATVFHNALLCRGQSPFGDGQQTEDWNALFYIPKAAQVGQPSPNFSKNAIAMTSFEFSTIKSDTLEAEYYARTA